MKIAFVGCGFVFDIYMRTRWAYPELEICGVFDINRERAAHVGKHYGLHVYDTYELLLADADVSAVINLTNIAAHYEVTRRALLAGKHVYSEKPLTTELSLTRDLFELASQRGLVLTGAPCNVFADSIRTLLRAVRDGAIGKPVLVYAELDYGPAHLMKLEHKTSSTGAPWPYVEEFQSGCTFEHIGYHLAWICALLGPVVALTAFSKQLIAHKTDTPLSPADTPDYSVANLAFANGAAARVTCSIVAPRDHRLRVIGLEGELCVDSYSHFRAPVTLERFSPVSLAGRKLRTLRNHPVLGRLFGVGGQRLPLLHHDKSHALNAEHGAHRSLKTRFIDWLRRHETYCQDKLLGVAEMERALREQRPQPLTPDFLMHINEITLLVQRAGSQGLTATPSTTFAPFQLADTCGDKLPSAHITYRPRLCERLLHRFTQSHD